MSKKVTQRSFGGPEVLEVIDVPVPAADDLGPDEVLVRVAAAGVNPVDWKTRAGIGVAMPGDLPFTVGWDLAGTVEALGPQVTGFAPGDRVFAMSRFPFQAAAYAQYAVVPAGDLVATPAPVTDEAAAALPLAALTAWQGLIDTAQVQAGQRVLIHGAGGGVGHLAVQIARHLGADVTATARAAKHDWLLSLGAHQVIDYTRDDFTRILRDAPVDLVLDFIAGDVGPRSAQVIAPGGLLVQFPAGMDPEAKAAADAAGVRIDAPVVHTDQAQLRQIAELAATGALTATVAEVLDLDKAAEAHRALESGHVPGKLVLRTW